MIWKKFSTIVVFIFFLFSLFYGIKNLFFHKTYYCSVEEYKESIKNLKTLLEKERRENEKLRKLLGYIEANRKEALELFIRDYLQMVKKDEGVLKP